MKFLNIILSLIISTATICHAQQNTMPLIDNSSFITNQQTISKFLYSNKKILLGSTASILILLVIAANIDSLALSALNLAQKLKLITIEPASNLSYQQIHDLYEYYNSILYRIKILKIKNPCLQSFSIIQILEKLGFIKEKTHCSYKTTIATGIAQQLLESLKEQDYLPNIA